MNYLTTADAASFPAARHEPPPFAWLPHLLSFVRRRLPEIGFCLAASIALGTTYLLTATPKFTATAQVLIDPRAPDIFKQAPVTISDAQSESAIVDSQLEILQSEGVAGRVVDREHLLQDEAFVNPPSGLIGQARATLTAILGVFTGASPPPNLAQQRAQAVLRVMAMQKMRRIGLSNVIEIAVKSATPALAARLANAFGDAFIDNELQSGYDASRRASVWMEDHLAQLHAQATDADAAVQRFRAQHRLLNTDKGQLDQQRLGELSTALAAAHARTAEARGRLAGIQAVLAGDIGGATVDSLGNLVIVKLREEYFDDSRRAAEWSARYGANHQAVLALRRDMARLRAGMKSELDRIAQSYASDFQVATSSEQAIGASYDAAIRQSATTNADQVTLRALQSNADTYGGLYQNFLQRDTLAAQDQSFPISQARIVSAASVPIRKSAPLAVIVLGIAGVLGAAFGFALAFARETLNQGLHTASQTRLVTGLDCIGLIPIIEAPRRAAIAVPAPVSDLAHAHGESTRALGFGDPLLRHAKAAPFSAFSEAMRHLHVNVQRHTRGGRGTVLGCVSSEAGEGKSTIICNLAVLTAAAGRRVILLDWDLRKRTLTRALAPHARHGLADVAAGTARLEDAIFIDAASGLHFLPAGPPDFTDDARHAGEVLGMDGTAQLVSALQDQYDFVLVDLPPLRVVADAHSVGHLLDVLVMVVAWGKTDVDQVNEGLLRLVTERVRMLGLVLNKVDGRKLRHYTRSSARYLAAEVGAKVL
jgi:succinoglycan biosynthesis transport protein ExoP